MAEVGVVHLLGDWKKWFTGVSALFNSTDAPYIVKMTWSHPKMPCPQRFFFWFLANAATKFHISVIQWARKRYITQKLYIMALFLKILITYNCYNSLIFLHVKIYISKILIPIKIFCFSNIIGIKKVNLQNFTIFPTILRQQRRHRRWIIFASKNYIFC